MLKYRNSRRTKRLTTELIGDEDSATKAFTLKWP
jgi:hypothetical protein